MTEVKMSASANVNEENVVESEVESEAVDAAAAEVEVRDLFRLGMRVERGSQKVLGLDLKWNTDVVREPSFAARVLQEVKESLDDIGLTAALVMEVARVQAEADVAEHSKKGEASASGESDD